MLVVQRLGIEVPGRDLRQGQAAAKMLDISLGHDQREMRSEIAGEEEEWLFVASPLGEKSGRAGRHALVVLDHGAARPG